MKKNGKLFADKKNRHNFALAIRDADVPSLSCSIKVVQKILVLLVRVRILAGQQKAAEEAAFFYRWIAL